MIVAGAVGIIRHVGNAATTTNFLRSLYTGRAAIPSSASPVDTASPPSLLRYRRRHCPPPSPVSAPSPAAFNHLPRRHHHDTAALSRTALPADVFHRTVTVPPGVVDHVTPGGGEATARTYNAVWLRENCHCAGCHNAATRQRAVVFHQLAPSAFDALSVVAGEDGRVKVLWADGHLSRYQLDAVERALSSSRIRTSAGGGGRRRRLLWNAEQMADIEAMTERVEYDDLVAVSTSTQTGSAAAEEKETEAEETEKSLAALRSLLGNLLQVGFAFVDGAPADIESTMKAARRICQPLRTFFGEEWTFGMVGRSASEKEMPIDMKFSDTAYTDQDIGVHTDGTYWSVPPGIQIFHCIQRAADGLGGDTVLVDGFNALSALRHADRASFDLLARLRLEHRYIEPGKFRYRSYDPIIKALPDSADSSTADDVDGAGLECIRYNVYDRAPIATVAGGPSLPEIYSALAALGRLVDDPSAAVKVQLRPGRILFIDNWRVLHGRTAFTGQRILGGCYLPRDDWICRSQSLGLLSATAI